MTSPASAASPASVVPRSTAATSALAASGIPGAALAAYQAAAAAMSVADPSCRLDWSLLAGIGKVESHHGRFGGRQPRTDGSIHPPILGIALDGRPGVALITDTDGGRLDFDATYDRAVGPMQFIPGTWAGFGADGNGDGVVDPHNLYDAALAAARYLCAGAGDLSQPLDRQQAVLRYNHSQAYVDLVTSLADAYALGTVMTLPSPAPSGAAEVPATAPVLPASVSPRRSAPRRSGRQPPTRRSLAGSPAAGRRPTRRTALRRGRPGRYRTPGTTGKVPQPSSRPMTLRMTQRPSREMPRMTRRPSPEMPRMTRRPITSPTLPAPASPDPPDPHHRTRLSHPAPARTPPRRSPTPRASDPPDRDRRSLPRSLGHSRRPSPRSRSVGLCRRRAERRRQDRQKSSISRRQARTGNFCRVVRRTGRHSPRSKPAQRRMSGVTQSLPSTW